MQAGSCVWILPYSTLITPLAAAYGNNCWKPCFKALFYQPSSMAFFTAIYPIQWVFWTVTSVSRSACSVCNFVLSDVLATLIKVSLSISFETLTSSKTLNKKQNRKIHHKEAKSMIRAMGLIWRLNAQTDRACQKISIYKFCWKGHKYDL